MVLPGHDLTQAFLKASEIRVCVRNTTYVLDQNIEVRLQASFGVATFPEDATDIDTLLAAADLALFAVKNNGKNGIGQYKALERLQGVDKTGFPPAKAPIDYLK